MVPRQGSLKLLSGKLAVILHECARCGVQLEGQYQVSYHALQPIDQVNRSSIGPTNLKSQTSRRRCRSDPAEIPS